MNTHVQGLDHNVLSMAQTEAVRDRSDAWLRTFSDRDIREVSDDEVREAYAAIHERPRRLVVARKTQSNGNGVSRCIWPPKATSVSADCNTRFTVSHTLRIERWFAKSRLNKCAQVARWMEALDQIRDINRRVFTEIYTTFYFTRVFGAHPVAAQCVNPAVLLVYNRAHAAIQKQRPLTRVERKDVYY